MTVAQPLLIAALALKFGWMGLGYADALPSTIDSGGVWLESRADGVLAGVIGAVLSSPPSRCSWASGRGAGRTRTSGWELG